MAGETCSSLNANGGRAEMTGEDKTSEVGIIRCAVVGGHSLQELSWQMLLMFEPRSQYIQQHAKVMTDALSPKHLERESLLIDCVRVLPID